MSSELTPITHKEMVMAGKNVEPITREEKIMCGEDIKPITRSEMFLKIMAEGGGSSGESISWAGDNGEVY